VFILFRWTKDEPESIYGLARILGQLLVVVYFLSFISEFANGVVVTAALLAMVFIVWILGSGMTSVRCGANNSIDRWLGSVWDRLLSGSQAAEEKHRKIIQRIVRVSDLLQPQRYLPIFE
jgi:ABC-type iron transport system FetAB permease component